MSKRLWIWVPAILMAATAARGDTIVFADGEFAATDWELSVFWKLGDGGVVTGDQVPSGGDPGAFRRVVNVVFDAPPYCGIGGFHRHVDSVYDPGQGEILSIDYREDAIMLAGAGQGQGAAPALRQDGVVFLASPFATPETTWTSHVLTGLVELDFQVFQAPDLHPDFSEAGGVIEFGFARQNSTYSGGYTIVGGIDNWEVTLHTAPPVASESATWGQVKMLFW